MGDMASQGKSTPTRPRQQQPGGADGRPGTHKAYASENDVSWLDSSRHPRAPQTPEKAGSGSLAPTNRSTAQTGSRQRNRNRPKGKNVPMSPESAQRGRHTPPHLRSASAKPATSTAFAGATFHASPAPSALPIPSFLAKSSTDTPKRNDNRDIVQEPSPPATDIDALTPFRPSSVRRTHESPLDFMFRAHREEKERQHRAIVDLGDAISTPSHSHSHSHSHSGPAMSPDQTRPALPRQVSGGIDSSELDGSPGLPMGPAFSTPYQERIRAARSDATRPHSNQSRVEPWHKAVPADDPTEALKNFLFGRGSASGQATPKTTAAPGPIDQVGGHTPPSSTAQIDRPEPARAKNVQAMENDLRRILKLDLTSDSTSPDRGLFSR